MRPSLQAGQPSPEARASEPSESELPPLESFSVLPLELELELELEATRKPCDSCTTTAASR